MNTIYRLFLHSRNSISSISVWIRKRMTENVSLMFFFFDGRSWQHFASICKSSDQNTNICPFRWIELLARNFISIPDKHWGLFRFSFSCSDSKSLLMSVFETIEIIEMINDDFDRVAISDLIDFPLTIILWLSLWNGERLKLFYDRH